MKIKAKVEKVTEPIIQPPEPVVVEEIKPKKIVKKKLKCFSQKNNFKLLQKKEAIKAAMRAKNAGIF